MKKHNSGFTLIELMIAVTLGLLVLAALTSFFVRTSYNRSEMERTSRQIENGRFAINVLRDDLMLTGYYADVDTTAANWQLPTACDTTIANMGWLKNPLNPNVPVPITVFAGGSGRPTACTPDYVAGTDVVVVRRFNSEPIAPAAKVNNLPYMQVSECATDAATVTPFVFGAGSGTFGARQRDCSTLANLWRYREQLYYVRNYSTTAGDGIPTLVRMELDVDSLGNLAMNAVALVEGIETLRVDLGSDNNNDGVPDSWLRCAPCTVSHYQNAMAAKIYVVSRTLEQTREYTDDKTYAVGISGTFGPFNDHYKRHVYSALVTFPNRVGPREPILSS